MNLNLIFYQYDFGILLKSKINITIIVILLFTILLFGYNNQSRPIHILYKCFGFHEI